MPSFPRGEQVLFDSAKDPVLGALVSSFLGDDANVIVKTKTTRSVLIARGPDSAIAKSTNCTCPLPMIRVEEGQNGANPGMCCNYPCMLPFYSDAEYATFKRWIAALNVIGALCGAHFVTTYLVFEDRKHLKATLYFAWTSLIVSLTLMMNGFASNEALFCSSRTESKTQKDGGYCLFQGMVITFAGLTGTLWWLCQAHNLFLRVYMEKKNVRHVMRRYHVLSWGYPAFVVLITLATSNYGYSDPFFFAYSGYMIPMHRDGAAIGILSFSFYRY